MSQPTPAAPAGGPLGYFKRHPVGFWFIFWGELAERCAYYGVRALFVLYMTTVLFVDSIPDPLKRDGFAQDIAFYFKCGCYLMPLLGGWIADRYLGKYWTIVGFAVPYVAGPFLLGIPVDWVYYLGLGVLCVGSGVIKPNISTLMGMTYDQKRPGDVQIRTDAFFMFYFAINVGSTFSYAALPLVAKYYGYQIAFGVPGVLMAVALTMFAIGKKHYAVEVINRAAPTPEEQGQRWAVLTRIFGVFALISLWWMVYDQNDVTWLFLIRDQVELKFLGYDILPNQPHTLNPFLLLALLPAINLFFKWIDPTGKNFPPTRKIFYGFLVAAAAVGVLAYVSYSVSGTDQKASMWWIALAFFLLTTSEVLVSTVGLELAFTVAPPSMMGFITACFLFTVFLGNSYNIGVAKLYQIIGPTQFFSLMAVIMLVSAGVFSTLTAKFNRAGEA